MSDETRSNREYREPASDWVRDQLAEIERTGTTTSVQVMDRPIVVMDIEGAKSGLWRRVPVMRVEHDGSYAAVASAGGQPKHPAWYPSLVAHPDIDLQDGTESRPMRARELEGAERATWWDRCVAAYPPYAEYQTKTDRLIPVLVLEPADASGAAA